MKKFLILVIVVLMAIVGCSKREAPTQLAQKIEPTEVAFGTVKVATIPAKGIVVFDGDTLGPAPVERDSLAPGPYTYQIFSPDTTHADSTEAFYEVKAGLNSLMVQLRLKSGEIDTTVTDSIGSLVINANQTSEGGRVFIDGIDMGLISQPEFRDTLSVGVYAVKISKEGYWDFTARAVISANQPTYYDPHMAPLSDPEPTTYHLEVVNGSFDGDYEVGQTVQIFADQPQTGWHFTGWTGNIDFANANEMNTSIVMPPHDLTVTANYAKDEPIRVEFHSPDKVRLYGDGHQSWLGLECYFPAQDSTTGWYSNLWVRGQDRGEYTEWNVPAPYSHAVIWSNAVAGLEGQGGSGVPPRFTEWSTLQKGTGISNINTSPGYFVIQGR